MTGITGLLSAGFSLALASQNQHIGEMTVSRGRIREWQGNRDGNQKAIEEGQEMQAKGEEIKLRTFEHLGDAISDIDAAAKESEEAGKDCEKAAKECEKTEASDESGRGNPSVNRGYTHGELDVVIDDTAGRNGNMNISASGQGNVVSIAV